LTAAEAGWFQGTSKTGGVEAGTVTTGWPCDRPVERGAGRGATAFG